MSHTLCQRFQATAAAYADEIALRTADGAVEVTWAQYVAQVERAARGLAALGVRRGDTVALMVTNRPEFHVLDVAALHLGATPFSIYATNTVEQIAHVFTNAGNAVVITEQAFLERVVAAAAQCGVPHVVALDADGDGVRRLEDVLAAGAADLDFEAAWRAVEPDDIATLIYTSGTTGPPKGVMLSHANLHFAWEASVAAMPALGHRGRYVSYLPTAHLADRVFSHYPALVNGSSITCVDDPRAAVGLLGQIRPTLWLAVPRIWEKLKDTVEAVVDMNEHAEAIRAAIALGHARLRAARDGTTLDAPDLERLAAADARYLQPIRARLGLDSADVLVSGAAPIREDVLDFFAALGLTICEGYGMTECTAVATLNVDGPLRLGSVGAPVPGLELKLAEDGEVLVRGGGVMVGYRGEPEKTAETIDGDGWLHTGDIGMLDGDGCLRIVDRKKELIINAAGKNMSPANIEARLKAATPLIGHAVAIGDRRPYNTALLVLDGDALALWGHRRGLADSSPAVLAGDGDVLEEIAGAVERANTHLSRVEQIKRWTVLPHEWEAGGELLTPTLKLKRKSIANRYAATIEGLYA